MIAVVSPSSTSTSGRPSVGMKPCTNALYVSLTSRCDSAAIVPNTSELFPDPDTPVNTVSRRLGSATLTSLRLFTRAPVTRIRSWRSAAGSVSVGELIASQPNYGATSSFLDSCSGEDLRLELVELGLVDRAAVEQLLGLRDLVG